MNTETPNAPIKLTNAQNLENLLLEATKGIVLVLETGVDRSLNTGALAIQALKSRLQGHNGSCSILTGQANIVAGTEFNTDGCSTHEKGWIASGELYEQFHEQLSKQTGFTHIFCADPWALILDDACKSLIPDAKWIFLSSLDARHTTDHPEYWEDVEAWIQKLPLDYIIPGRMLLSYLEDDFWASTSNDRLFPEQSGTILIDEAGDAQPAPEIAELALAAWGTEARIIFLSPYLPQYIASNADFVKHCHLALDTNELALPVYLSLLQNADIYIAPTALPFGSGPLMNLSHAEVYLPSESASGVQQTFGNTHHHKNVAELANFIQDQIPKQQMAHETITGPEDSHNKWWQQLSDVCKSSDTDASTPDFAILTCCYKYLQRFRIFLDSIARQDYPRDRIEICVAAPGNPDGLFEYLELFHQAHQKIRISVVEIPETDCKNRGKMINAAFKASSAPVVMAADCDIILPSYFIKNMLSAHSPKHVLGCWRTPLDANVTAHIVTGNLDPVDLFDQLHDKWDPHQAEDVREGVLGYCQIVTREVFAQIMYPEEFDMINQSDIEFINRLQAKLGVQPKFIKDMFVLHLYHERDWSGTKVFL